MVKPGGTGSPRLAISARLAPLPPSKSRSPALPSALPSPNVNTHLPDFAASAAGLLATTLPAGLYTGLAGLSRALRAAAGAAALARAGIEGFDFAATFLALEAALAMTAKQSARGREGCAPYTTLNGSAQDAKVVSTLHVKPFEQPEANQAGANQIDRDHEIKQPRDA